ncbi:hypothetical protein B296_00038053 [Ensete ventricosum]|uniref:Uncharacterized protein n=1 Tax=Ensete ventricosum TaxID=4639 RepID=A0A426Z0K7_ENSVE|nr:hypothetical protein B296_00038053 [Ensete ventricosum]
MLGLLYRIEWIRTTGFEPRAREALHAGDPRSAGVDAPIVTLMQVFLTSLGCSCKIRPLGWWIPGEVPPTIKLGLIRGVKLDVLLERCNFFSFFIEVERESLSTQESRWGATFIPVCRQSVKSQLHHSYDVYCQPV